MLENLKKRFFVVIHTVTNGLDHALESSELAHQAGADGVFLIPDYAKGARRAAVGEQFSYLETLKVKMPKFLIGVNFLVGPEILIPRIYDAQPDLYQTDSSSVLGIDALMLPDTEFFVGVAFKYSKNVHLTGDALKEHCEKVSAIADVPTTSGNATGIEADLKKTREIRSYLPDNKRLGIASGVTDHNVKSYLQEGVTDFLVATSLIDRVSEENGADILNFQKVLKMSEIIHSF
mgnify:CR=1 FL=1